LFASASWSGESPRTTSSPKQQNCTYSGGMQTRITSFTMGGKNMLFNTPYSILTKITPESLHTLFLHHNQQESLHQRIKESTSTKQALTFVIRVLINRPPNHLKKVIILVPDFSSADYDHIVVSYVKISLKNWVV
jgi:hypothetical protein